SSLHRPPTTRPHSPSLHDALPISFNPSTEELETKLEAARFQPCGPQDTTRSGWVPPLGRHGTQQVHETNGYQMVCLNREDKILRSEEHTSELQSRENLVCRLLLEQ